MINTRFHFRAHKRLVRSTETTRVFVSAKRAIVVLGAVFLLTAGLGCRGGDPDAQRALSQPVTLEWWGVFDTSDSYQPIIQQYQAARPNVQIRFRKFRYAEYEKALLDARARGKGPDIFYVHNTWIGKYADQALPMPEQIRLPVKEVTGVIRKEEKAYFREYRTPSVDNINDTYIDIVRREVVRDEGVIGLPVAVDTLALYYNRTLLDREGILSPPGTWQEVADNVQKLTRQDEFGNIVQSGIALGAVDNIPRSVDIVMLLMLQNGAEIFEGAKTVWHLPAVEGDSQYYPGAEAVRFYTDFANLSKVVYTWNEEMPSAVDAFVQGRLAMMLGYAYQLPFIKAQGPRIDFGIAPVPHINPDGTDAYRKPVNLANYWVQVVSDRTEYPNEAWDFVLFLTGKEQAKDFTFRTRRPSARRDILNEQLKDKELAPFARAALTARGWYQGRNALGAEKVVEDMLRDVIAGKGSIRELMRFYARRLEQTL